MKKASIFAVLLVALAATPAVSLDVKNVRFTYGPFGGPRTDPKVLPGDFVWFAFDIDDLKMEPESGLVKYNIRMEVSDSKGKLVFKRDTPNQRYLALGKGRISERAQISAGADQAPGKYTVKMTVSDINTKASKEFTQSFEILPAGFGFIHVSAPSIAVTNQDFTVYCALVGMARDAKKRPSLAVRLRILDEKGELTLSKPFVTHLPEELPEEIDVTKAELIPVPFPLYLNRPGRFTLELEAVDRITKKEAGKLTMPLHVFDTSAVGAK